MLTIVNANMANAIRSRTVQKGHDPRDFSLVAFGGAGPLHGVEVAHALGIPTVLVPPYPGITSAVGLLTTDLKYDTMKTEFQTSEAPDVGRLTDDFATLELQLAEQFAADGIDAGDAAFQRAGDLRYVGQGYELRIPFPAGEITENALAGVFEAFHEQHRVEYGHVFADSPLEIVNIRVTGTGRMPKIGAPEPEGGASLDEALIETRDCVFRVGDELKTVPTPLYARERLPLDAPFTGPAIILQKDTTTVAPPGTTLTAEPGGNLLIRLGG